MPTITICTDAGHQNFYHESIAAWACYIRTPVQTIRYSGVMKKHTKGSSQAEMYAIANALWILAKEYDLSKYRLIVYSDNLAALRNHRDGTLRGGVGKEWRVTYNLYVRPYVELANEYCARHAKGHLPPSKWNPVSARHYMQDWCDKEVHKVMKERRNEILASRNSACVSKRKSA